MIQLTDEQRQELEKPEPIFAVDPRTGQTYILLRTEVYDRVRSFLADDAVYTTAEMLDRIMAEDDANDPMLAELQKKYGAMP